MSRIDFYVLPDDGSISPGQYVYRLIGKIYRLGHLVHLHCADESTAQQWNDYLWQAEEDAFLPHSISQMQESPISIHWQAAPSLFQGTVLVNLSSDTPDWLEPDTRIAEVVPGNPSARTQCRDHFRIYQQRGYAIKTHSIPSSPR
jgi:DNA polymerase-3 subunit chi